MFNKIIVFFIGICLCATQLHAGPANPDPVTISQPDGSKILTRLHGDEFQNWTEHVVSGHTIIRNKSNGFWEYAEQNADGTLKGSGVKVVPDGSNAPANIKKGLTPPRNKERAEQMNLMLKDVYQERLNAAKAAALSDGTVSAAVGDWIPVPVSGSRKMLLILVGFADRQLNTTPASWNSLVFDAAAKSVAKYYKENSFNTLTISPATTTQPGIPTGIISVTLDTNHPNTGSDYTFASDQAWGNAALSAAAPYVDYASLDTNGNGILEPSEVVIYFIVAGYETSASSGLTPSVWAHAWRTTGTGLTAGTKNVQRWSQNGEYYNASIQMTMGVIAHELGHQMGGLPDLYDTSSPTKNGAMGSFSLMAGGSWGGDYVGGWETGGTTPTALDAWSREFLGWTTPITPTTSGSLSLEHPLSSQNAAYKFVSPLVSSTEYFLVENRQPTGWDLGLRRLLNSTSWAGGLLITHIDITSGTYGSNDINNYDINNVAGGGHQGVVPVQASTATCNMLTTLSRGCTTTLYYASNNASWGPVTTPNSNYYSGAATNFSLTGISAQSATMTGSISFTPPVTKSLTVAKDGTGSGTVTSAPAGISCGSTCSASFLQNEAVTLTAVGDSGSIFTGWSGGGCSGTGTCVVSLSDDTAVTATFTTATSLITENFDGASTPSLPAGWLTTPVEPAAVWATHVGTNAPSGIAAHSGANLVYFNSWSVTSGYSAALTSPVISFAGTSNNTVSFWMYRDTGYSTYADRVEVYVNTAANLSGATLLGTVYRYTGSSPTVSGAGWYNYSFSIPETFTSASNYLIIKGISGYGNDIHIDDVSVSGIPVVITQRTLTVNHAYTSGGTIKGGGSISGSGISCSSVNGGSKTGTCSVSLDDGSTVTLAAAADANSTFSSWSGGGCSGSAGCSFSITTDTTVTGSFAGAYKAKISGSNGYDTLTLAHANAADNAIIQARELHNATTLAIEPFVEDLSVTKPITLKGGYNAGFSSNAGLYSTLSGILTIGGTTGSLTVENLIIK